MARPSINIKEREAALIRALRSIGGRVTRKRLAQALNVNRLTAKDVALLEVLADMGKIKREIVPTSVREVDRYEYWIE